MLLHPFQHSLVQGVALAGREIAHQPAVHQLVQPLQGQLLISAGGGQGLGVEAGRREETQVGQHPLPGLLQQLHRPAQHLVQPLAQVAAQRGQELLQPSVAPRGRRAHGHLDHLRVPAHPLGQLPRRAGVTQLGHPLLLGQGQHQPLARFLVQTPLQGQGVGAGHLGQL